MYTCPLACNMANTREDPTEIYRCPNWIEGHKTCAKHRMWLKDAVCLSCSVRGQE